MSIIALRHLGRAMLRLGEPFSLSNVKPAGRLGSRGGFSRISGGSSRRLDTTETDRETETAAVAEPPAEMPLPTDPKGIFLGGLFALALLATAYVAGEIVLPMVFAITLKLLLQPWARQFPAAAGNWAAKCADFLVAGLLTIDTYWQAFLPRVSIWPYIWSKVAGLRNRRRKATKGDESAANRVGLPIA
jgi:hypothetical protein